MADLTPQELAIARAKVADGYSARALAECLAHERSPRCSHGKKRGGWKGEPYAHSRGCFLLAEHIERQLKADANRLPSTDRVTE